MRVSWKSVAGWLAPLCYLALPNCSFEPVPATCEQAGNLQPGCPPLRAVVFCDIEKPMGRRCAEQVDLDIGIPLAQAAVALRKGQKSTVGLDHSPEARARCNGRPEAVSFQCPFPHGCSVGMNCSQIGPGRRYETEDAVCRDRCADLFGEAGANGAFIPKKPPDPEVLAFCADRARVSTNILWPCNDLFYLGACDDQGALRSTFQDPRRHLEPVFWRTGEDGGGVVLSGNTITRTRPGAMMFDAGASSGQTITHGDGFVEFTAVSVDHARALGLSTGATPVGAPSLAGIGFGVRLSPAADLFIHESSDQEVPGGNPNGSFATYATGDRIRVEVVDNNTEPPTATIRYVLIPASCPAAACDGTVLRTAGPARYPLRVDGALRNEGAQLNEVNLVRIKQF